MKKSKNMKINRIVICLLLVSAVLLGWTYYLQVRKIDFEYELDSEEFISAEIDGINSYFITEEVTELKGSIKGQKPDKLKYTLYGSSGYVLGKGKLSQKNDWTIDDVALLTGANILVLEARFNGRIYPLYRVYSIYNENEENEKRLNLEGKDTDGDGLDDLFELKNSYTNPEKADSDGNGINDGDEDTDGDGLSNATELQYGCLVNEPDSDLDGVNDADELKYGCDPCKYDTDEDGVSDACEIKYGLDPNGTDDNYTVNYSETISLPDDVSVEVVTSMDARDIYNSLISTFPAFAVIADEDLDCVLSQGIVMSEETRKSDVKIRLKESSDKELYVCTVNENGDLTAVNVLGNDLMDVSEYMKVDKGMLFFTDIKTYVKRVSGRDDSYQNVDYIDDAQIDNDRDGFTRDIDPDDNKADVFMTYENYLNYYFSYFVDSVMGFAVKTIPVEGHTDVINLNITSSRFKEWGHSWAIFSYRNENIPYKFESKTFSFFPDFGTPMLSMAKGDSFKGRIETNKYEYIVGKNTNIRDIGRNLYDKTENAEIILPCGIRYFDYTGEEVDNLIFEYNNDYMKDYNLYTNNCTTFVIDLFRYLGIELEINTEVNDNDSIWNHPYLTVTTYAAGQIARKKMSYGCSPGQAAYCIMRNYPDEYVYRVYDYELKAELNGKNLYDGYTSNRAIVSCFKTEVKSRKPKGANVVDIEEDTENQGGMLKWDDNYLELMRDVFPYLDSDALFHDEITIIENLSDEKKIEGVFEALTWGTRSLEYYESDRSSWPSYYVYSTDDVIKMASIFTGTKPTVDELDDVAKGLCANAVSQDIQFESFKVDNDRVSAIIAQAGGPDCSIDKIDLYDNYVDVYYSIHWVGEDAGIPWVAHFVGGDDGLPKFEYAKRLN